MTQPHEPVEQAGQPGQPEQLVAPAPSEPPEPAEPAENPEPLPVDPDTKDWTWTLRETCPQCGFSAGEVGASSIAGRVPPLTDPWQEVLVRSGVARRPTPTTWSPLEYACHVRDVCRVFTERVDWMLGDEDPEFPNWDQDAAAVAGRYHRQDPAVVARELRDAADDVRLAFAAVEDGQWLRTGQRSNGSRFTVESLGQYLLHDLAHHLVDVGA